jgi:phospholipid/cholesterol/gamma-HCH transport system substrate-binding protein
MTRSGLRDLVVGVFVLMGLGALGYLSFRLGGAGYAGPGGLEVIAYFDEVGGLSERAPVVIGGVKVGQVVDIGLDADDFRARVTMDLDASLQLPDDSSASVVTQGVLGDKLVAIEPGGSDQILPSGGTIEHTQSAVVLERLIGRLVTNFGSGGGGEAEK